MLQFSSSFRLVGLFHMVLMQRCRSQGISKEENLETAGGKCISASKWRTSLRANSCSEVL